MGLAPSIFTVNMCEPARLVAEHKSSKAKLVTLNQVCKASTEDKKPSKFEEYL